MCTMEIRPTLANAADCTHAVSAERATVVRCNLNLYGGRPHVEMCRQCAHRQPLSADTLGAAAVSANTKATPSAVPAGTGWRFALPSPTELRLATMRASMCQVCQHNGGITLERDGRPVFIVRCKLCGRGGLSLIHDSCQAHKWPVVAKLSSGQVGGISGLRQAVATGARRLGNRARAFTLRQRTAAATQSLLLKAHLSPGDTVTLTAVVRDLHRAYPGRFATAVDTTAMELWEHNPYVRNFGRADSSVRTIAMHYPLVNQSNQRPAHFLRGYTDYLEGELDLPIPTSEFRGDVYLSDAEKNSGHQVRDMFGYNGPFWMIFAGGKYDFTAKWWSPDFYQAVVDHFRGRIQFVQCGEAGHWHPSLKGVFNLVGKTSLRQLVRLMYHTAGVVCPVTLAMHLTAAVPTKTNRLRPCVVIAGGREPPHWEAYPGHQFLHTVGMLSCCGTGGCWKSRCQKVGDNDFKDKVNLCERPTPVREDLVIPQCMAMIKPGRVIEAVEGYLAEVA